MSTTRSIVIESCLEASKVSRFQWRVVLLCFLLAIVDGFDAQAIAYVAPLLHAEFEIDPTRMGQLFSVGLVGLMIGAFMISPFADRFGRKKVIIFSSTLMGFAALMTATSSTLIELFAYRFLTGLGLGGVMPTINILTAEFAPPRQRAFLMTLMFVGFPVGAVSGGIASVWLIEQYGWQSVFVAGGIVPIALLLVNIPYLPESIRFLVLQEGNERRIGEQLAKIDPTYRYLPADRFQLREQVTERVRVASLFDSYRAAGTLLIWAINFANLLVMYSLFNWLPSVMQAAGFELNQAILAAAVFSLGGVIGGLVIASAIDRFGPYRVIALAFIGGGIAIASIGIVADSLILATGAIFLSGFAVFGTQFGMNAVVATFYPTNLRVTGLGWALAVGRIGSIIGPVLIGLILSADSRIGDVFLVVSVPQIACALLILTLARTMAKRQAQVDFAP